MKKNYTNILMILIGLIMIWLTILSGTFYFSPPINFQKKKISTKQICIIEQLNERGHVVTNWKTFNKPIVNNGFVYFQLSNQQEIYISKPFRIIISNE